MEEDKNVKVRSSFDDSGKSAATKYRELFYGKTSLCHVIRAEMITAFAGRMSGAAGMFWRSKLYPGLFGKAGKKVFIGKNVSFRHFKKIQIGNNVIIDDNCLIDAKGDSNDGIIIEDNVYIGRNTIVYCKNGNITLKKDVNISSSCTVFSSNSLTIEEGTVIGAYSYLLSGGEYDHADTNTRFADQSGMKTKGELVVGANCWLGARVTVLDAANIGEHSVIGAGAVVTKPVSPNSLAAGVPAKKIKSI